MAHRSQQAFMLAGLLSLAALMLPACTREKHLDKDATVTTDSGPLTLTIKPEKQPRRLILAEQLVPARRLAPPFALKDSATGQPVACQWEPAGNGHLVRWLIPSLPADKSATFLLEHTSAAPQATLQAKEDAGGFISVQNDGREFTRYNFGPSFAKFKKPYFYPVIAQGQSMTRSYPMAEKAGETKDHVHHTGVYFAYGEVNKKEYWSKLPITHKQILQKVSGPLYARIVAENAWGDDLTEIQDITLLEIGQEVVMDWVITLKADKSPVHLGPTKEGGFSVRVAQELIDKSGGKMVDSEGRTGEKQIWSKAAPWVDYYGQMNGKTMGIAMFNHPTSFGFPTEWHARSYGLFAANPFFMKGDQHLKQGESLTLKHRLYFHAGDVTQANVQEVFNGYATAAVEAK